MSHYHHLSSTGKVEINFNDESVEWVKEYKLLYTIRFLKQYVFCLTGSLCYLEMAEESEKCDEMFNDVMMANET